MNNWEDNLSRLLMQERQEARFEIENAIRRLTATITKARLLLGAICEDDAKGALGRLYRKRRVRTKRAAVVHYRPFALKRAGELPGSP